MYSGYIISTIVKINAPYVMDLSYYSTIAYIHCICYINLKLNKESIFLIYNI